MTGLDTESSTVYTNPDGTVTAEQSSVPFQAQVAPGEWKDIDNSLVVASDGTVAPEVSLTDVEFAKAGSTTAASFGTDQKAAGFSWSSNLPAPSVDGDVANYADVLPNTDLTANATATGFEVSLVVKSKPAGTYPTSVTMPLTGTGVTWSITNADVLTGKDAAGRTVVTSAGAQAWDSTADAKTDQPLHLESLDISVTGAPGAQSLVVALPTGLLNDAATVYPITIDPSTSWTKTAWTYVDSGTPTTSYYNATGDAPVGKYSTGIDRSLFAFGTSNLHGTHVLSATLTLSETWSASCTASQFDVYDVPSGFTSSTTWNAQPTLGTKYASVTAAKGFSASCPAGNVTADLTSWAAAVAAGSNTTSYLELRATNEADANSWKKFNQGASITVTYNSYPSYPYGGSISPCGGTCSSPANVSSTTPQFTSYAWDADNNVLRFDYEVWAGSAPSPTTRVTYGSTSNIQPGSPATWTTPTSMLTNGSTYETRVRAYDGTDYGPWTSDIAGWKVFTVDTTVPATPSVSSSTWTAGAWSAATSGTISWSDTSTDVTAYAWQLDGGSWSAPSSATSQVLSGLADGTYHTFNVRVTDTAGNESAIGSFGFGVGAGGLTSPSDQDRTQANVTLSASGPSGYSYVYYQWRQGTTASWINVPSGDVTIPGTNTHPSPWPITTISAAFVWNLANTVRASGGGDGLVQVQACLSTSSSGSNPVCQGTPVSTQLAATAFGDAYASREVGPGSLALLTGDYSISGGVEAPTYLGSISVGRTLTTLAPSGERSGPSGVFGPAWTASLPGPSAGEADLVPQVSADRSYVFLTAPDGAEVVYTATTSLTSFPIQYTGMGVAHDGSTMALSSGGTALSLTEVDGTVTAWSYTNSRWTTTSVIESADSGAPTTAFVYGTSGLTAGLPTMVIAPAPSSISCTATSAPTTPGCRSLSIGYQTVTVGTSTVTRIQSVSMTAFDPITTAMSTIQLASYDYDANGRLAHAWDPRITPSLKIAYGYNAAGRLSSLTPPGQTPWTFDYDAGGRLATVTRMDPSGSPAVITIVYGVPLSGSGAPLDMSGTTLSAWAEVSDLPVSGSATAIFSATHQPAGQTPATVSSSDWPYSEITYMDVNGRDINEATYGASAWQITTQQLDKFSNVLWTLSAENRAEALSPTANTAPSVAALGSSDARAVALQTSSLFNPDSLRLLDIFGPTHPVVLSDGSGVAGRSHTHYIYDEGSPGGAAFGLTTRSIESIQTPDGVEHDSATTRYEYDPINSGDTSGWDLGMPTKTIQQMGSSPSSADLVSVTRYNPVGQVIEQRLPAGSSGGDAATTQYQYYTATGSGSCVSLASAGLQCTSGPAAQPAGSPIATTAYTYDVYGDVISAVESFGTVTRQSTTVYDGAHRLSSRQIVVTPTASGGTAVPSQTFGYDSSTGLPTTSSTVVGGVTTTVTTGYDSVGRTVSYQDATGTTSTYGYDLSGRRTSFFDGKGTTTYSYDTSAEHRGLVTGMDAGLSPALSQITATYDGDGRLTTSTLPNGLVDQRVYDNAGFGTKRTYTKSGSAWMTFTRMPGAESRVASESSPLSRQIYTYDGTGRMSEVADDAWNTTTGTMSCVTRVYQYDANSNRTSVAAYPDDNSAPTIGHCTKATSAATTISTYDAANRILNTGYAFDSLGRGTSVPAADAISVGTSVGITGNLTVGYFANDLVASESQGGVTVTYGLDPQQNRIQRFTVGSTTTTNHFSDSGDSPRWTSTNTNKWTRNVAGPDGALAVTQDQAGATTLILPNLHGDVVSVASDSAAASGPTSYSEFTEFGVARTAYAVGTYGWLGSLERSSGTLGGMILMGVRLYNPITGRFLSVDPVEGGNANQYVYPQDPVNQADPSGLDSLYLGGSDSYCNSIGCIHTQAYCSSDNNRCEVGAQWYLRGQLRYDMYNITMYFQWYPMGVYPQGNQQYGHGENGTYYWHTYWGRPIVVNGVVLHGRGWYHTPWGSAHLYHRQPMKFAFKGQGMTINGYQLVVGGQVYWNV